MISIKSKIDSLEKKLEESKDMYEKCLAEIQKEISKNYYSDSFEDQVRRAVSLFRGEYIKYNFDKFNNDTLQLQFSDKSCSLVSSIGYMSDMYHEEKGFLFKIQDALEIYNISNNLEKIWMYNCKTNNYRKSYEDFKNIKISEILDLYVDWYRETHSKTYITVHILSNKELIFDDIVYVAINSK